MKYIFITGGVMSGLGKGITAASVGRILKNRGYRVTAVKIDPYLNIDAGTMNPAQHGEVFVLKDGGEVDLDLGNYERFLDIELTAPHNITTGKVYRSVIEKERRGDFLGETVQIIPHITDQIKSVHPERSRRSVPRRHESRHLPRRSRRDGRRYREHAVLGSHPPDAGRAPAARLCPDPCHPDPRRHDGRPEDKADPALGQGPAGTRAPCRYHRREERAPDRRQHKTQDLGVLRSPPERGHLRSDRPRYLRSPHGDGKGRACRCPVRPISGSTSTRSTPAGTGSSPRNTRTG